MESQLGKLLNSTKACGPCRSAKRRCDRLHPRCARCRRNGIRCIYAPKLASTAEKINYEASEGTPSPHPALTAYFLDRAFYASAELKLPSVNIVVIQDLRLALGDTAAIHATAKEYFDTVHIWLPIISKRRFYQHFMNTMSDSASDFVLTLLCMKLCILSYDSSTSKLYNTTKHAISQTITTGHVSLYTLQAAVLLTMFEIGHALYPDAFLSIGWCARLGSMLGIEDAIEPDQVQSRDKEEARRVWWSVLILDRFLALGNPQNSLVTHAPTLTSILPVDDELWDSMDAEDSVPALFQLGSATTLQLGRFGRLAQTTYLLDQVICLQRSSDQGAEDQQDRRNQLCRALMALSHLHHVEQSERRLEFCTQSAVCFSAILMLVSNSTPAQYPEVGQVQSEIHDIIPRLLTSEACRISPLLLHAVYRSATIEIDNKCTPPRIICKQEFEELKATLKFLKDRWRLAAAYLQMLESAEATTFSP